MPKQVEVEIIAEMNGFVADVSINYQFGEAVRKEHCLEAMTGFTRMADGSVYLEGNFDAAQLAALIYFMEE